MSQKWIQKFTDIGMIWQHDGNPKRPYAQLTSGNISNGFVNCTHLISRPKLLNEALKDLMGSYKRPDTPCVYVGQAMGSITIAYNMALLLESRFCWSIKANNNAMQIDPRFTLSPETPAVIVEDVTTTGGTTLKTRTALEKLGIPVAPYMYTLVNRSGKNHLDSLEIRALVTLDIQTWAWGNNPFTPNGMELITAVRPKEHWEALRKDYP